MPSTSPDELAQALGVPSSWGETSRPNGSLLQLLVGVHMWETLGRALAPIFVENVGPNEPPSVALPSPLVKEVATNTTNFHSNNGVLSCCFGCCSLRPADSASRFAMDSAGWSVSP